MYRWAEHTGELELEIEAGSEQGVFEEAFRAMRGLLRGEAVDVQSCSRHVSLHASDRAVLLADWLGELAFLSERGSQPAQLTSLELCGSALQAVIGCRDGNAPHLVKAATYHRLALEAHHAGWRARVVLDV